MMYFLCIIGVLSTSRGNANISWVIWKYWKNFTSFSIGSGNDTIQNPNFSCKYQVPKIAYVFSSFFSFSSIKRQLTIISASLSDNLTSRNTNIIHTVWETLFHRLEHWTTRTAEQDRMGNWRVTEGTSEKYGGSFDPCDEYVAKLWRPAFSLEVHSPTSHQYKEIHLNLSGWHKVALFDRKPKSLF